MSNRRFVSASRLGRALFRAPGPREVKAANALQSPTGAPMTVEPPPATPLLEHGLASVAAPRCAACGDTGRVPWAVELDGRHYVAGSAPCDICGAGVKGR